MKTFIGTKTINGNSVSCLVAAKSQKELSEIINSSITEIRNYWSETRAENRKKIAGSKPGTIFVKPLWGAEEYLPIDEYLKGIMEKTNYEHFLDIVSKHDPSVTKEKPNTNLVLSFMLALDDLDDKAKLELLDEYDDLIFTETTKAFELLKRLMRKV